jgi:Domain of unknown function (DUF397)
MNEIDLSRAEWHKSSYSSQDGNCVEVATDMTGTVAVRDSKDPQGPALAVSSHDWQVFVRRIKSE